MGKTGDHAPSGLAVCFVACLLLATAGGVAEGRKVGTASKVVLTHTRRLEGMDDLGGVELKQERMRMDLQEDLDTMRVERKAMARSGKKAELVADEAEEIADKWRDIQIALLELYNVEPQTTPDDDDFYNKKVEEVRNHLASIYETAKEAAVKMEESSTLANEAADAFVDSDIKTEEGDLGVVAEVEDVEQEVAETAQKAAEEGEEIVEEANEIAESAETVGDQLDDLIAEIEGGDEDKIKDSLESMQQTVEEETEMAEQLEDDASHVASEAEQASIRAESEKQNIIREASYLGVDLETKG
ncbi:hypothetical protein HOP50_02g14580 [Chloropicon primus]|uniref:Uncharacterized protein n=1 Tax=Chloropicon primus TaxID=1764295 RepID=A0A5B8MHV6_9CHLO|nr:hypothetical protein A3770_02p14700 [Chloropicon primus]UPQ98160.1 hypothetical protein HOP50_02g14580 [Chloropicon primus]|eukprot:QDZ18952.1 hypothetical protein A3770_02p14700 [Chloropicon primus]